MASTEAEARGVEGREGAEDVVEGEEADECKIMYQKDFASIQPCYSCKLPLALSRGRINRLLDQVDGVKLD